jgi:hypothetical protein
MMGKKDFGIWKRKPDWVGERAGMALVNANVYYGNFRGKPTRCIKKCVLEFNNN